jgi:hypothetical protein
VQSGNITQHIEVKTRIEQPILSSELSEWLDGQKREAEEIIVERQGRTEQHQQPKQRRPAAVAIEQPEAPGPTGGLPQSLEESKSTTQFVGQEESKEKEPLSAPPESKEVLGVILLTTENGATGISGGITESIFVDNEFENVKNVIPLGDGEQTAAIQRSEAELLAVPPVAPIVNDEAGEDLTTAAVQ